MFGAYVQLYVNVQDRDYEGLVETRLYLGVATRSSFRTYTVVAENAISVTTKLVQLLHSTYVYVYVYACTVQRATLDPNAAVAVCSPRSAPRKR